MNEVKKDLLQVGVEIGLYWIEISFLAEEHEGRAPEESVASLLREPGAVSDNEEVHAAADEDEVRGRACIVQQMEEPA